MTGRSVNIHDEDHVNVHKQKVFAIEGKVLKVTVCKTFLIEGAIWGKMNTSSVNDLHECSQTASVFIASSIFFLSIASFVSNSLIVVTFLKTSSLRTSTNYLIVNMAISDLLSSATNWPLAATEGLLSKTLVIDGSTATFERKIGHFSRAISQAVSVESLLLIVVDRYIAIVLTLSVDIDY